MDSVRFSALFLVRWRPGRGGRRGLPEDDERSGDSLAAEMNTPHAQLNRVLDPEASNVTLDTLSRAARVLGHSLKVELV